MSALSRFGPTVAKSALFHQYPIRHMASASAAAEPVQRIFLDKIKEFQTSNKGLDEAHKKAMVDEMDRLRRVFRVEDESKVAKLEYKFPPEVNVSLHDIDEKRELREQIASGEYQKKLVAQSKPKSALLASIPEQVTQDMHLPPMNKPDIRLILENQGPMLPAQLGKVRPDYEYVGDKMTPEKLERDFLVKFGPDMPTIDDDKSPQRDIVNFPRENILLDTPPTRYHIIPESWFRFFYPKTGVTGPYAFAGAFTTFLFSKEWLVWEHELLTGVTSTIILSYAVIKFGPKCREWVVSQVKKEVDGWEEWRTGNIKSLEHIQKHYKGQLAKAQTIKDIYEAREQDIEVQLEGEYRRRLRTVYEDTMRRLNYLVSVADSQRQIAHKNMVNWVISNAVSSIGQKQEAEILDDCIVNLKQLASKNAKAI